MDYDKLAESYMSVMCKMSRKNIHVQLHNCMHGEYLVLFFIEHKKGEVLPGDISNELGITSARVAAVLKSLEGKGLIERELDSKDRRKTRIRVTETGKIQMNKQYLMVVDRIKKMLEYLGEEDATELVRIMQRIADKNLAEFMTPIKKQEN